MVLRCSSAMALAPPSCPGAPALPLGALSHRGARYPSKGRVALSVVFFLPWRVEDIYVSAKCNTGCNSQGSPKMPWFRFQKVKVTATKDPEYSKLPLLSLTSLPAAPASSPLSFCLLVAGLGPGRQLRGHWRSAESRARPGGSIARALRNSPCRSAGVAWSCTRAKDASSWGKSLPWGLPPWSDGAESLRKRAAGLAGKRWALDPLPAGAHQASPGSAPAGPGLPDSESALLTRPEASPDRGPLLLALLAPPFPSLAAPRGLHLALAPVLLPGSSRLLQLSLPTRHSSHRPGPLLGLKSGLWLGTLCPKKIFLLK